MPWVIQLISFKNRRIYDFLNIHSDSTYTRRNEFSFFSTSLLVISYHYTRRGS